MTYKDDENPEEVFNDIKRRIKENRPEGELTSIILELWDLAKVRNDNKEKSPFKTTFDQLKKRPLKDIDPLSVKEWETTRVTLLGDAAHAMNPWMALGTNSAIEDAFCLSEAFGNLNKNNWKEIFYNYEKEMRIRTSKNVIMSRKAAIDDHVSCNTRAGSFYTKLKFKCLGIMFSVISLCKGNGLGK